MYKLLLVTDQPDVQNAFESVTDWEMLGFRAPHVRTDTQGAIECLGKHHADGISFALDDPEEENNLMFWLQEHAPELPIFGAGRTADQVRFYLSELGILLNRLHADFSNDNFGITDMYRLCRHEFFRKLIAGSIRREEDLIRNLRLLRSKMDPDRPCVLVRLCQPGSEDRLAGRWHYGADQLEYALRQVLGAELQGMRILPAVLADGRVLLLYCPLLFQDGSLSGDSMTSLVTTHTADCITHAREFLGVEFSISALNVLPSLKTFCTGNEI